jgi:hypothetical protein
MNEKNELLPCPFCGAEAAIQEHEPHAHSVILKSMLPGLPDHPGSFTIECMGASCNTGQIADTREAVISMWNRRAARQALLAQPLQQEGGKDRLSIIKDVQNHLVDVVRSFGDVSCAAYISTWHKPEAIEEKLYAAPQPSDNLQQASTAQAGRRSCCEHDSDCAVHNAPAYPVGPCDCSVAQAEPAKEEPLRLSLSTVSIPLKVEAASTTPASAVPEEVLHALDIFLEEAGDYCDKGPIGAGWQSNELSKAVCAVRCWRKSISTITPSPASDVSAAQDAEFLAWVKSRRPSWVREWRRTLSAAPVAQADGEGGHG